MPSFQDSAFIILLGLLLFGPKGMAKMARQVGKLVGEFRRASAEFRLQMEDELRVSEQEDQQKKIAAMEAAAPVSVVAPAQEIPEVEHPHLPSVEVGENRIDMGAPGTLPTYEEAVAQENAAAEAAQTSVPLPIASSGELEMMPPATGLPVGRGASARTESLSGVFDGIPHVPEHEHEAAHNG